MVSVPLVVCGALLGLDRRARIRPCMPRCARGSRLRWPRRLRSVMPGLVRPRRVDAEARDIGTREAEVGEAEVGEAEVGEAEVGDAGAREAEAG